jgi:sialic acid synthase SpsE
MSNSIIFPNKKKISLVNKPYIIAEIGSNFNQNFVKAKKLILQAKYCGVDAVKFQLFKSKKLYPDDKKMYKIFKSTELNPKWIPKLKKFAEKCKLDFLCSCFDLESAKILYNYNLRIHKIASSEIENYDLSSYLIKTKKPILLSTGMSDIKDVKNILKIAKKFKNNKIVIMQCTSMYPLSDSDVNLNVLKTYARFGYVLGFSDHTLNEVASLTAVGLGARVFEKHFTLNKKDKGPDHIISINPKEMKNYVKKINQAFIQLGSDKKDLVPFEKKFCRRKGVYFSKSLKRGTKIKKNFLKIKAPAMGLRARDINSAIGKVLKKNVYTNKALFLGDVI